MELNRRNFFKISGAAAAASLVKSGKRARAANTPSTAEKGALGSLVDTTLCVGCRKCEQVCNERYGLPQPKESFEELTVLENERRMDETSYTVVNKYYPKNIGTLTWRQRPTFVKFQCMHCNDPSCVSACIVGALTKEDNGAVVYDVKKCIGCRYCMYNCPYGVISFNWEKPFKFWREDNAVIKGCTVSPRELVQKVNNGTATPYYNPARAETLEGSRPKGVVEKCTFCDHRVKRGELPYCVEACPANARIFGDLENGTHEIKFLLGKFRPMRLKEHLGTEPKVYYIRNFNPAAYDRTKGGI